MSAAHKVIRWIVIAFAVFLAGSIICGVLSLLFALPAALTPDTGDEQVFTAQSPESIRRLDINLSAADLTVTAGEELTVTVNSDRVKVSEKEGVLSVADEKGFFFNKKAYSVQIVLPKDRVLDVCDIETGAGALNVTGLNTSELELELGAGKAEIKELTVGFFAEISGGAGDISMKDVDITDLDLDLGVGKTELSGKLSGVCDIDTGVGELSLKLSGGEELYTVKANTGVGEFKVAGRKMSDGEVSGSGNCRIDIDGGVGKVSVDFQ